MADGVNEDLREAAIDDARSAVRRELATLVPFDALERVHLARALAWVDSRAPLCRVACPDVPPMHLVAYVVVMASDEMLLVDHRNARLWLPAGGHVEPGEHPRLTAARELREELGFDAPHPIGPPSLLTCSTTVGPTAGHTDVSLWYVVRVARDQPIVPDAAEFERVRWFATAALPERRDPHLERFVAKRRAGVTDGGRNAALRGDDPGGGRAGMSARLQRAPSTVRGVAPTTLHRPPSTPSSIE